LSGHRIEWRHSRLFVAGDRRVIDLEEHRVVVDDREEGVLAVETDAAEHTPGLQTAYAAQLIERERQERIRDSHEVLQDGANVSSRSGEFNLSSL